MYLRFFLLLLLCSPLIWLSAQDFPYQLSWKQELVILGTSGALSAGAHLAESQMPGLTANQLEALRAAELNGFDRQATKQKSDPFRRLSDDLLRSSALAPGLLMVGKPARNKALVVAVLAAETFLVTEGLTKTAKVIFRRNRPLTYNTNFSSGEQQSNDARQSFPSGHTSITAGMSFFAAKVFHDLHPESKARPFVWAGAALLPAATGYARYRAGKHFPTDIIAGYALGATVGIIIPELHKPKEQEGLSLDVTGSGLGLVWRW